jgi:hypothetical protein
MTTRQHNLVSNALRPFHSAPAGCKADTALKIEAELLLRKIV